MKARKPGPLYRRVVWWLLGYLALLFLHITQEKWSSLSVTLWHAALECGVLELHPFVGEPAIIAVSCVRTYNTNV